MAGAGQVQNGIWLGWEISLVLSGLARIFLCRKQQVGSLESFEETGPVDS